MQILKGIPKNVCPAQAIYSPDGTYIIGVGFKTTPRKLGLMWCTNRSTDLFKLDFENNYGKYIIIVKQICFVLIIFRSNFLLF